MNAKTTTRKASTKTTSARLVEKTNPSRYAPPKKVATATLQVAPTGLPKRRSAKITAPVMPPTPTEPALEFGKPSNDPDGLCLVDPRRLGLQSEVAAPEHVVFGHAEVVTLRPRVFVEVVCQVFAQLVAASDDIARSGRLQASRDDIERYKRMRDFELVVVVHAASWTTGAPSAAIFRHPVVPMSCRRRSLPSPSRASGRDRTRCASRRCTSPATAASLFWELSRLPSK